MIMKAIQVKYLPVTDHKPSRWKAWAYGGLSAIVSYDYGLDEEDNARRAADAVLAKMEQHTKNPAKITAAGCLPNGDFVFTLGT